MTAVPPEELRTWVGPFADADTFLRSGADTLALLKSHCALRPDHEVLDVGCGSGRVALALSGFLSPSASYLGFDPHRASIDWCREHIARRHPNFRFEHVDVRNSSYNPDGELRAEEVRFPCTAASIDVALLSSVFTHLLPSEVDAYARELARVLRPGALALISFFLMNAAARGAVRNRKTIFDFRHRVGAAWTFSPDDPAEGLAYDEAHALATLRAASLGVETVHYGTWRDAHSFEVQQDWVVVSKPAAAPQARLA